MEEVATLYSEAFARHGATPDGVMWNGEKSQKQRFELICSLLPAGGSVGDFGCGYAEFIPYAKARGCLGEYVGVDITETALEGCRKTYPEYEFYNQVISKMDYWIVSGTFNLKGSVPEEVWGKWVQDTIKNLLNHAEKGVIVNFLDRLACDWYSPNLFYTDEVWLQSIAKATVVRMVGLREFTARIDK